MSIPNNSCPLICRHIFRQTAVQTRIGLLNVLQEHRRTPLICQRPPCKLLKQLLNLLNLGLDLDFGSSARIPRAPAGPPVGHSTRCITSRKWCPCFACANISDKPFRKPNLKSGQPYIWAVSRRGGAKNAWGLYVIDVTSSIV